MHVNHVEFVLVFPNPNGGSQTEQFAKFLTWCEPSHSEQLLRQSIARWPAILTLIIRQTDYCNFVILLRLLLGQT
jgi:hypothetical protein